jgi:hypothetical protein
MRSVYGASTATPGPAPPPAAWLRRRDRGPQQLPYSRPGDRRLPLAAASRAEAPSPNQPQDRLATRRNTRSGRHNSPADWRQRSSTPGQCSRPVLPEGGAITPARLGVVPIGAPWRRADRRALASCRSARLGCEPGLRLESRLRPLPQLDQRRREAMAMPLVDDRSSDGGY